MKLLYLQYKGNFQRYLLGLEVGYIGDKLVVIESSSIDFISKSKIKQSSTLLNGMTLGQRIEWFKKYTPSAMSGMKTLLVNKVDLIKEFEFGA